MRRNYRRGLVAGLCLLAAAGALGVVGCSLRDQSIRQCQTDADCSGILPGARLLCQNELCVACERHTGCPDQMACVEGGCTPLEAEGCEVVGPSELEDGTVVLGALLREETAGPSDPARDALALAAEELNRENVLDSGSQTTLVACRAQGQLENGESTLSRSTEHLLRELKVPGLLTDLDAVSLHKLARPFAGDRVGGPVILAVGTALSGERNARLWHLGGGVERLVAGYRVVVDAATDSIEREPRVAVLRSHGNKIEEAVSVRLKDELQLRHVVGEITISSEKPEKPLLHLRRPLDVLVVLSVLPDVPDCLRTANEEGLLPPVVVLAPEYGTRRGLEGVNPELFVGLRWTAPPASDLFEGFVGELPIRSRPLPVLTWPTAPGHYDALHLLAYASLEARLTNSGPVSADSLADSLSRLISMEDGLRDVVLRTGPEGPGSLISLSQVDQMDSMLVAGVTGPMWFRREDGARRDATMGVWCVEREKGGAGVEYDGAYVNFAGGSLDFVDGACGVLQGEGEKSASQ